MRDLPAFDDDYVDLYKILPREVWEGFTYSEYYIGEDKILKPALEKLGYKHIQFSMGERDSFGPLSRIVWMMDKDGNPVRAIYG